MRWYVTFILLTGILQAYAMTGSITALAMTLYGQILIVKLLLVCAILAAAMYSRTRHMDYMASGDMIAATGMRRAITHEIWVALVVLALSSWLVHVPSAGDDAFEVTPDLILQAYAAVFSPWARMAMTPISIG